ncbi:D-threonine aldolase [Candidatus Entotheonellaceae bacterium PAL068K]
MQLDTPALVVDLSVLGQNINTVHAFFEQSQAKLRPHVSAHRCPAIAHLQMASAGTVGGISVTTLGEAEVFASHGFRDIVVANEVVTPAKIGRLCTLARHTNLTVAVDHPIHIQTLSTVATSHSVTLRVAVDIQVSPDQCGVQPGQPALELARAVCQAPHLELAGLMTTPGRQATDDTEAAAPLQVLQPLLSTRSLLEQDGMAVHMVSVGEFSRYEAVGSQTGITEVRMGTYPLMDARHAPVFPRLRPAARVLTTITSRPEPGTAITDAGQKAVGIDLGLPVLEELSGATAVGLSAEHCRLQLNDATQGQIDLGQKVWLTPWDVGTCTNLYDHLHAVRHDVLEVVWPVAARGHYR